MDYTSADIIKHLEENWDSKAHILTEGYGPSEKLDADFKVVEFAPGSVHNFWIYSTAGMSIGRTDKREIELHIFSSKQDRKLIRILASAAFFHKNDEPLCLNQTVNIGEPWQDNSKCDHAFISMPYLDGEALELYEKEEGIVFNFWLIPITKAEKDYKVKHGAAALEELFEKNQFEYLDADRDSLI